MRRTNSFPRVGRPSLRFHIVGEDAPSAIVRRAVRILRLGYNLEFHRFAFFFLSLSSCLHICVCLEPSIAEDFDKISNTAVDLAEKILWILCQVKHQLLSE